MNDRTEKLFSIHKNSISSLSISSSNGTLPTVPMFFYKYFNNKSLNESMESILLYTNLTTLNLSGIPLSQTSLTFLLNALKRGNNNSQSKSLERNTLSSSELNSYSILKSVDSSSSSHTLTSLKQLILCQCQLTLPAIEMILNVVKNQSTLEVLRLADNIRSYPLTTDSINKSLEEDEDEEDRNREDRKGKRIDELDSTSENTAISMIILNSLLTSRYSQLQLVDLSYNKFPAAMLFQLISAFNNLQPHLRTIDLSGMDLGISCTELLAKNLKSYFSNTTSSLIKSI